MSSFYWKKQTPGSRQIRIGYEVWVKSTVLKDLLENYGPEAVRRSGWSQYAWKLVLHLVGGEDNVIRIKTMQKGIGIDAILKEMTILAVTSKIFILNSTDVGPVYETCEISLALSVQL